MKFVRLLILFTIVLLLLLLLMKSCGYISLPPDRGNLGENDIPYELCPPDGEAKEKPIFTSMETIQNGVFTRFGNFTNEKKQIFSIQVTGRDKDAINTYVKEVKVCSDVLKSNKKTLGISAEGESSETINDIEKSVILENTENLVIEIELVAMSNHDSQKELNEYIRSAPIKFPLVEDRFLFNDGRPVNEAGRTSINIFNPKKLFGGDDKDHIFDFIVDPSIKIGRTHYYKSQSRKSSNVNVRVNSGKHVIATLSTFSGKKIYRSSKSTWLGRSSGSSLKIAGKKSKNIYEVHGRWESSAGRECKYRRKRRNSCWEYAP